MKKNLIEQHYNQYINENSYTANAEQIMIVKEMDHFLKTIHLNIKQEKKESFLTSLSHIFKFKEEDYASYAGLYIYGGVGRGKSMLMNIFFETIHIQRKVRIHFHEFMQNIHTQLKHARKSDIDDPIIHIAKQIAEKTDLICFDELQITDITDAMVVGRLFDALINRNVKFIITSNRIPNDLYKNGLNRQLFLPFIRKIESKFNILPLDHETDYRSQNITDIEKYFTPLGVDADKHVDKIWTILTNNNPSEIRILTHQGRKITIHKCYKNIAYIDFSEFCNKNYGVSDYLLIAKEFNIIIFDNIPKLNSEMRNQATRFRNFIDAIYEAKNIVYFIADTKPHNLYEKGDFSFEFERTASRIKEITSSK